MTITTTLGATQRTAQHTAKTAGERSMYIQQADAITVTLTRDEVRSLVDTLAALERVWAQGYSNNTDDLPKSYTRMRTSLTNWLYDVDGDPHTD